MGVHFKERKSARESRRLGWQRVGLQFANASFQCAMECHCADYSTQQTRGPL